MKVIIGERLSGKTMRLIEISADTGDCIVCSTRPEASRVARVAEQGGFSIPFPLTFAELRDGQCYGKRISGLLIDNADSLLQGLSDAPIHAITMREENVHVIPVDSVPLPATWTLANLGEL